VTRRGFHILVALILLACAISPFVESAIHWNQTILETGYDTESTIGVIVLLFVLALALAKLLAPFLPLPLSPNFGINPSSRIGILCASLFVLPESPPTLPLRI
jgi:hypothetical protein